MLKIASPLLRFPAIFGVFFALFAGTILFSSTAHAANSQPTYTLTAGSLITAKGGFIDDPNASNPMFVQSGGKWVFEGEETAAKPATIIRRHVKSISNGALRPKPT